MNVVFLSDYLTDPDPIAAADAAAVTAGAIAVCDADITLTANETLLAQWTCGGGVITRGAYSLSFQVIALQPNLAIFDPADTGTLTLPLSAQISPGSWGAKFDGVADDSDAWIAAFALSRPVYHPGGSSVVSKQVVNSTARVRLFGPNVSGRIADDAQILCTKGGITPIQGRYLSVRGIGFGFTDTATSPGGTLYANALTVTGSISANTLTIPGGGLLANASVGSLVVVPSDNTRYFDYCPNNYADGNSIAIITAITSDTTATLACYSGLSVSSQTLFIRGNAIASLWNGSLAFPTVENCIFGLIPGAAIALTDAQQISIRHNFVNNLNGGAHIAFLFARSRTGADFQNPGSIAPWDKMDLHNNMIFGATGACTLISGAGNVTLDLNEYNPGGTTNPATDINTNFVTQTLAPYYFSGISRLKLGINSSEDCAPYTNFYFNRCVFVEEGILNTATTAPSSGFFTTYYAHSLGVLGLQANTSGTGSSYQLLGGDNTTNRELLVLNAGYRGAGVWTYDNGAYGSFAPFRTARDEGIVYTTLTAATLKAVASPTYVWNFFHTRFGDNWNFISQCFLEWVTFLHGAAWNVAGGMPTVDISTPGAVLATGLDLRNQNGYFMIAPRVTSSLPAAWVANALGPRASGNTLTFTFKTGGPNWNSASVTSVGDFTPYFSIKRAANVSDPV